MSEQSSSEQSASRARYGIPTERDIERAKGLADEIPEQSNTPALGGHEDALERIATELAAQCDELFRLGFNAWAGDVNEVWREIVMALDTRSC